MNEDEKQTDQEHTQSIPWMDRFDKMKESQDPPDIDFITRLHELEGR